MMKGGRIVDAWAESAAEKGSASGPAIGPGAADEDLPISDTFEYLIDAGKELAEAELAWAKARGAYIASAVAWIGGLGALAFALAFALIVTLMVGAVFALTPHIGPGLALLAVCATAALIILGCLIGVRQFVRRIADLAK
jgi:hypothetical protein